MTERENILRAYKFQKPDRIPVNIIIGNAYWSSLNKDEQGRLEKGIKQHKMLFPNFNYVSDFKKNIKPWQKAGIEYTDSWGCVWKTTMDGITGSVIKHPLDTWEKFENYSAPDPMLENGWERIRWEDIAENIGEIRRREKLCIGGVRHGFLFLTLEYIRGYENLIYDMHDENPNLLKLIDMVERFNSEIIKKYVGMGVDMMNYPEDLGTQHSNMISPDMFRKYIKPSYKRLMAPAKEKGIIIRMHSDGYIMNLADDLIDCGVDVLNLQDLVNGIDNIQKELKGRVAIDLDIDRQNITRFGTAKEIDDLIREAVMKLGSKEGGLSLKYDFYPGIPIDNAIALMDSIEKYSYYY